VLLGCGLGGSAALLLAREAWVRAVIALNASASYPAIPEELLALMDHPHVSQQHAGLEFTRGLIGSLAGHGAVEAVLWGVSTEVSRAKKADYGICSGLDLHAGLDAVKCPVLLARGAEDWLVDGEMFRRTAAALTGARALQLAELPGTGHFPMQEQPERLAALINDFLQTI
jgi:pimeloyl-ACP methyl ester carboxylesterase